MKIIKITLPVVFVTIVVISIYLLTMPKVNTLSTEKGTPANLEKNNESVSDTTPNENNKYINYSAGLIDKDLGKRRILFFYANWCPTCRPADAEIRQRMSEVPEDIVIIRVNYNDSDTDPEEESLAQKYEITYQHTYVLIGNSGEVITKWNGGSIDNLLSKI